MSLIIPEKYHDAVTWLNSLDTDVAGNIFDALSDAPPTFAVESLVAHVESSKAVDVEHKVLAAIVSLLVGLYYIWGSAAKDLSREDFVQQVIDAAKEISLETNWERLNRNLHSFLQLDKSIGITAKAFDLMTDYDRVFAGARVITDSRPIFTADDSDDNPIAVMITHMLKIEYRKDDESHAIYTAMDSNDIRKLQSLLERALMKEARLKKLAKDSGVPYLDAIELENDL